MARRDGSNVARILKRDDIRGKYPDDLDEETAYCIGRAMVTEVLRPAMGNEAAAPLVAVGWDARLSSPSLGGALMAGLTDEGADVLELGQCSSEVLYFASGHTFDAGKPDGGVMVTASHNPKDENGCKMVKTDAEPINSDELQRLGARASELLVQSSGEGWESRPRSASAEASCTDEYAEKVRQVSGIARAWDRKLRVVVEAGNGVGGVVFLEVAKGLPYLDVIPSNIEPDGNFPVCLPNPVKPEYMRLVQDRVVAEGADLGIAFDGDGDRVGVVGPNGEWVTASEVLAVLVDRMLPEKAPQVEVMYNLLCSRLVRARIDAHGAQPIMTPVGHAQIKALMRQHPACPLGGEHSGHYFFRDFLRADSGTIAALMVIEQARVLREQEEAKGLGDLVGAWRRQYLGRPETNFDVRLPDPGISKDDGLRLMQGCLERAFRYGLDRAAQTRLVYVSEGGLVPEARARNVQVRTEYDRSGVAIAQSEGVDTVRWDFVEDSCAWWFCVRPSGNEPLVRLNVEVVPAAHADGPKLLDERYNALVRTIGPQYLEESSESARGAPEPAQPPNGGDGI